MATGWTARELAQLTGVPTPTLSTWISSGLVSPEHYGRGRRGHTIGIMGLLELLAVIELRQAGFSLQAVRRAIETVRKLSGHEHPLAHLTLVIVGKDIAWKESDEISQAMVSTLVQPGQRLMLFPIGEKHAHLMEQLEAQSDTQERPLDDVRKGEAPASSEQTLEGTTKHVS